MNKRLTCEMIRATMDRLYPNHRIMWVQNTPEGVMDTGIFYQLRDEQAGHIRMSLFNDSDPCGMPFVATIELSEFFNETPSPPRIDWYDLEEARKWPDGTHILAAKMIGSYTRPHTATIWASETARKVTFLQFTHFAVMPATLP